MIYNRLVGSQGVFSVIERELEYCIHNWITLGQYICDRNLFNCNPGKCPFIFISHLYVTQ